MAFNRKTWLARISEYPNRRLLTNTSDDSETQVLVTRDEGVVSQVGDKFDAATMNDLEGRINTAFNASAIVEGTPFILYSGSSAVSNSAQTWDSEGEFLWHLDVPVTGMTADSLIYNPVFNTAALDILAPYLETVSGAIRLYVNESTTTVDINCLSYSIGGSDIVIPEPQSGAVTSVNGQTGAVTLTASDVGALPSNTTYVSSVNGSSGSVTIGNATSSAAGLMSATDKANLDAVVADYSSALSALGA